MPTIDEILASTSGSPLGTQLEAVLDAGLETLSANQTVEFKAYARVVLPVDGFVFWVNAALLSPAQLSVHGLPADQLTVSVKGSLHHTSTGSQADDENIVIRRMILTAERQITAFAEIAPTVLYVGVYDTAAGTFKFTFSSRNSYYQQANLHHYVGDAVYPALETQLIETLAGFDQRPVVSNSLPLWLAMFGGSPYPSPLAVCLPAYPAYLVPDNLRPPYAVVDVIPTSTRALQAFAALGPRFQRSQLVTERVLLTFYGLRNDEITDVLDYLVDYSGNTGAFGIANLPVIRDEKRTQVELSVLAMKKTIDVEINYDQRRSRDVARQVISNAFIGVIYPSDRPLPDLQPPIVQFRPPAS